MSVTMTMLAAILAAAPAAPAPVPGLEWEVVSRRPHDTAAFTQGLVFDDEGRLFESVLYGDADLREVEPRSGTVVRSARLPAAWRGEGLALVDGELVQLTWKDGVAVRWDRDTFEALTLHPYDGQGWGLCHDGERLVMSDGSDRLTFRDAATFELLGQVRVTLDGEPLEDINELECVGDAVWANVWRTDTIVRIDAASGQVTGRLDLGGILEPHPAEAHSGAVLNGIAYDAGADTFLVTGKYWPEMIEIRVREPGSTSP
jgi:glutamine cyclotransferase